MSTAVVNDSFFKYGSVYYEPIDLEKQHLLCRQFSTDSKAVSQLYCFPCEVYIELISGLASIVVSTQNEPHSLKSFAIHHYIKLNPGVYFNILSTSHTTAYCVITPDRCFSSIQLDEPYALQAPPVRFNILEILDYYFVPEQPRYRFSKACHN